MQVLGLERDDVIISPFAVIVTVSSYGATLLLTLFFLCGESSTTSLTYQQAASRIGNCRFPSGCLVAILQGGGGISDHLLLEGDEGMYCSFFAWPFVFEDSLKISGVFCGKK